MILNNNQIEVIKAYCWIREHNTSIPDHILNTMKESALIAFEYKTVEEKIVPPKN